MQRYQTHAAPLLADHDVNQDYSQLLVVEPPDSESVLGSLRAELSDLHVILATSPLDAASRWLEVFPAEVSKAKAAAWLADRYGIAHAHSFAIGNDYNDVSMLDWAATATVVANAPPDLRARYDNAPSHSASGFAAAALAWVEQL